MPEISLPGGRQRVRSSGAAGQNYVLLKAIESGKIDFWVIPEGQTNLTLQTPPRNED